MGRRIKENVTENILMYLLGVTIFLEALFPDVSEEIDRFGRKCYERLGAAGGC